ncbi:MAG: hypothetical protein FWH29_08600 [Methanobrevibacter sp.]|nr:hypothetical protein [Methanobrevibacter sp.]
MPILFFDNNIPVGYCFMQDPQHELAKKAFENISTKYWSKNVIFEFTRVCDRKLLILDDFIDEIIDEIGSIDEKLSIEQLANIVDCLKFEALNKKAISIIVNDIWNEGHFNGKESADKIIPYLKDYKRSFKKRVRKFKTDCYINLNEHERLISYPKKEKLLKKCVDGEDSFLKLGNDMNICLDAHDLAKKADIHKLTFITDDLPLFDCKNILETSTKIYQVAALRKYSF